jgi:transcriptional regulator with XRE-family HTH domain
MNRTCQRCLGTGREPDQSVIGAQMARMRQRAGVTRAQVAERMGVDVSYICYLEAGRRDWSLDKKLSYLKALKPETDKLTKEA